MYPDGTAIWHGPKDYSREEFERDLRCINEWITQGRPILMHVTDEADQEELFNLQVRYGKTAIAVISPIGTSSRRRIVVPYLRETIIVHEGGRLEWL